MATAVPQVVSAGLNLAKVMGLDFIFTPTVKRIMFALGLYGSMIAISKYVSKRGE